MATKKADQSASSAAVRSSTPSLFSSDEESDDDDEDVRAVILNARQQAAFDAITANPHVNYMVKGAAGTGKSALMKRIADGFRVYAFTFHRFMQIELEYDAGEKQEKCHVKNPVLLNNLKRVVLEEIGMATAENLALLDTILQKAVGRGDGVPFGGVQIVAVGDFLQMPSVGNDGIESSPLWESLNVVDLELTEQMRQSKESESDGFGDAIRELRTLFLQDKKPPSPFLGHVMNCLSVDTGFRARPKGHEYLGVCVTRMKVAAANAKAIATHFTHNDKFLVVESNSLVRKKSSGKASSFVELSTKIKTIERGELGADADDLFLHSTPLAQGCTVCVSVNIYESTSSKMMVHNGLFGIFEGWSAPLPSKDDSAFGGARPIVKIDGVSFDQVTVRELYKHKIGAVVRFGDTVRTLHVIKGKGKKGALCFPIKCGQTVTASSLQGQTISQRLHVNFAGAPGVFDPQIVYTMFSRVIHRWQLSIENLNSETLYSWWKSCRRKHRAAQEAVAPASTSCSRKRRAQENEEATPARRRRIQDE